MEIKPNILEQDGIKEFAILRWEEFEAIMNLVADYEDLKDLREAKDLESDKPGLALAEVRKKLML